jgi:hypothetical protein
MKYPKDLIVTIDDFNSMRCNDILNSLNEENYSEYWSNLSKLARKKSDIGDLKSSKILWILADLCSMMLVPDSKNEPFKPFATSNNGRSAMPEDFTDDEISFLEEIIVVCENYKVKSRIADFLWLVKRDIKYIEIAVENYQLFSLSYDEILNDSKDAWGRAIRLSLWTRKPLEDIQKTVLQEFFTASEEDGYHLLWLHNLLNICQIEEEYHEDIYQKLEKFAIIFRDKDEAKKARDYFRASQCWIEDEVKQVELTIKIAEMYALEATLLNTMASAKLYEKSIQEYRNVPRRFRDTNNIDEMIYKLQEEMKDANLQSLDEMQKFTLPSIDLREIIDFSRDFVSGLEFKSALLHLANVQSTVTVDKLRKQAIKNFSKFPLQNILGITHLSSDGRVVSKRDGMGFFQKESKEYEVAIFQNMVQDYYLDIGLIVQGAIIPAYEQILLEHRVTKEDLYSLCQESSAVPSYRIRLWTDGLYFGFEYDFITAIHLLIPQVEHLVRVKMKEAGIVTTVLDREGVETEKGLSSLLDDTNIDKVFDENFIFELKALLTENSGVNLRNSIAHGLISYNQLQSIQVIYMWWFCLRIVMKRV